MCIETMLQYSLFQYSQIHDHIHLPHMKLERSLSHRQLLSIVVLP